MAIPDPLPASFSFLLQTKHLHKSTLGWCLHGPWAMLGWPLGGPSATQSQTQSQSQQAEGRHRVKPRSVNSPRLKLSSWASGLTASRTIQIQAKPVPHIAKLRTLTAYCRRSCAVHTLGRCWSITTSIKRIKCESGHSKPTRSEVNQPSIRSCPRCTQSDLGYALCMPAIFLEIALFPFNL